MKRLVFLDESVTAIFHAVLMASLWLLFVGHNQPGGGFVGGLVAGAAISLRFLAGGIQEVRSLTRFAPWTVLGAGLVVSLGTAALPMLLNRPIMSALGSEIDIPLLGHVYLSTTLAFDIGVYVLVVGLVFMVFEAFADEAADAAEDDARPHTVGDDEVIA